jgi:dihydrofolate reductase
LERGGIRKLIVELRLIIQRPGKDIILDGSASLVQSLMGTELIDAFWFLVQPIIIGKGGRFFTDGMPQLRQRLVESRTLSLGDLALSYLNAGF